MPDELKFQMEREKEIINSTFLRGHEYDIDFDDEEEEDEQPFEDAKEEVDSWKMKQTLLLSLVSFPL